MMRTTLYLLVFAVIAAGIAWLVDQPGAVSLTWQGYRVDTSVGVLLAAVAVLSALLTALYQLWRFLRHAPRAFTAARRESRRLKGYRALTQGMVAVAAGEPGEAKRQARRADMLLNEPPLTMLLSAQAAQLSGDAAAADKYFTAMLGSPETEFLGLRGLAMAAIKKGDARKALALVRRARNLRPKTGWVLTTLHDLETQAGEWQAAEETTRLAMRAGVVTPGAGVRRRAVALYQQSIADEVQGNRKRALAHARKAVELEPGFVPAAVRAAKMLMARGKRRRAEHIIEGAWARAPHPDLAEIYRELDASADPLKRLMRIQHLTSQRPLDPESSIALVEAALAARLWGEARRALETLRDSAPFRLSTRVCRLWAELEESEHGDHAAAREWLTRAATPACAGADPAWVCDHCGAAHAAWAPLCQRCAAYDSLVWRSPALSPAPAKTGEAGAAVATVSAEVNGGQARDEGSGPTAPRPAEAVTDLGN